MIGPSFWKRLLPRYGNWGGPGWSSGKWCPPNETDWSKPPIDALDQLFRDHDFAYQTHGCRKCADLALLMGLRLTRTYTTWAMIYWYIAYLSIGFRTLIEGHSEDCKKKYSQS